MKKMKRIMALMLAAIMMMAMSVTTFAAGTTCSLTVNAKGGQDLKGQTINLYKLFDVTESGDEQNKNYAYTVNTATGYKDTLKNRKTDGIFYICFPFLSFLNTDLIFSRFTIALYTMQVMHLYENQ